MTLGPQDYVPVLKVKRGEKKALQAIEPALRKRITPLLEIVERKEEKSPTVRAHLNTAFRDLAESVQSYSRCLLDARELERDGRSAASLVFRRASDAGITFTPVTGISRAADTRAVMEHRDRGIALRLTRGEFERGDLANELTRYLRSHSLSHEEIDLIVDLGPADELVAEGVVALGTAFLEEIPDLTRWRSLILSAGAFPPSMGVLERLSSGFVDRVDWIAWRDTLDQRRRVLPRLPTFSDGAIQHPRGVEGFDPRTMQVSASIRYTLAQAWLLIKGESLRNSRAQVQFPALAMQLVYGHLRPHFAGARHCAGCASIRAAADGGPRMFSLESWRRVGTIHHLTVVAKALAALPSP